MWTLCAAEEGQQRLYVTTYVRNLTEIWWMDQNMSPSIPCYSAVFPVTIICDACMAANATTRCLFVSPLMSCHQVLRLDPRRGCHKQGQRVGLTALTGPVAAVYSTHPGEHAHARTHTLPSCTRQALASIHRGKDPAQSWSKTSIS